MELHVLLSRSFLGVLEERLPAHSSKPQGQAPRMNMQGFGGGRIDYDSGVAHVPAVPTNR